MVEGQKTGTSTAIAPNMPFSVVKRTPGGKQMTYHAERVLGEGAFGVVMQAKVLETRQAVSLKQIYYNAVEIDIDINYPKEIMCLHELNRRNHPNIMKLYDAFWAHGERKRKDKDVPDVHRCLYLVMEYFPDNLSRILRHTRLHEKKLKPENIMFYSYQLFRGLNYMASIGYVHFDIKPQNILVDGTTNRLALCDFGTARRMYIGATTPAPYIQSRYYRSPEVLCGSNRLSCAVDVWSAGVVMAEMILGHPLFYGKGKEEGDVKMGSMGQNSSNHQMFFEIQKILGIPTSEEVKYLNHNYVNDFNKKGIFMERHPLKKIFAAKEPNPAIVELIESILVYSPVKRPSAQQVLVSNCFFEHIFGKKSNHLDDDKLDGTYPKEMYARFTPEEWSKADEKIKARLHPSQYFEEQEELRILEGDVSDTSSMNSL